jgi:hypothetical protein
MLSNKMFRMQHNLETVYEFDPKTELFSLPIMLVHMY